MKFLLSTALSLTMALSANSALAACDEGEIVVKFSHVTNTDRHPKGIAATLLQERVNAEMNGVMYMEVFPQSSLYNDDQVLEAMLQGDVQLAAPSLSKFEAFTRQFRIFNLPFMFANIEAVDQFQASDTGQAMLDSMQRRGLQGLGYWHNGMKQMSANVPLMVPTDAEGLKFRVQPSDVLIAQMEAMGASQQPKSFSEV
jgi:C4-dicarboxylate-binding protein DctP